MSHYNFGAGSAFARRTDTATAVTKPSFLGVLQELTLNVDQTLKELQGQYKLPVDIAPAQMKITGTAKFARVQADTIYNTILGQEVTEATGSGFDMAIAEAHTPTTTALTVTNAGASFVEDMGVFYHLTGIQLTPVTGAPGTGSYASGSGTYAIAAGDASVALDVYYTFAVSSLTQLTMANVLMGEGPQFELLFANTYSVQGTPKKFNIKLNQCRASKVNFPFKNVDYTIMDLEFQAFGDSAGNWGVWALTE